MSMSALLNLQAEYAQSSDDECSVGKEEPPQKDQTSKLPLPRVFTNVEEYSDEKSHQGRTRSFAHERGNWATHIYLPYPKLLRQDMNNLVDETIEKINKNRTDIQYFTCDDFHISVSKTNAIAFHCIEPMTNALTDVLANTPAFTVYLDPNDVECYINDEGTRSFVAIQVNASSTTCKLREIIEKVDQVLVEYNCSTYYENPSYHMSVSWRLGNIEQENLQNKLNIQQTFANTLTEANVQDESLLEFKVEHVVFKCGHKQYRIKLGGSDVH